MAELARAVRRSILVTLLLAVGVLAAALPTLLGEPAAEHLALRGLAALLIFFLASLFLAANWGSRGPLPAKAHLLELAKMATALSALLLPALFAGMTTTEADALATLAQTAIGWKSPSAAGTLALFLLAAAYVVARLKRSVKGKNLSAAGSRMTWRRFPAPRTTPR